MTAEPRTRASRLIDLRDEVLRTGLTEARVDALIELLTLPRWVEPRPDRIDRVGAEIIIAMHGTPSHDIAKQLLVGLLDDSLSASRDGDVTTERLVALEHLAAALILFGNYTGAFRCLAQYRHEVTTFALRHGAALPFERHDSQVLALAATHAFEGAVRSIAVIAAESGRMRYLTLRQASQMVERGAPTWSASDSVAQLKRHGVPDVISTDGEPVPKRAADLVARLRAWAAASTDDLMAAVEDVVGRWRSTAAQLLQPVPAALPRDLDMVDIQGLCAAGQGLVYPFLRSEVPGLILVTAAADGSLQVPFERLDDYDAPEANSPWAKHGWVGVWSLKAQVEFMDPVVIAWADAMSPALAEVVRGINASTIPISDSRMAQVSERSAQEAEELRRGLMRPATVLPSAQLLQPDLPPVELSTTAYFGDASGDLVGPWLEREAWRTLDEQRVAMGGNATIARLLEALRTCDLVVVSSHAGSGVDGNPYLQLADGPLRVDDLLDNSLLGRGPQVVLNCCRASSYSESAAAEEAISMATALLAMGARQVLAPRVVVGDGSAAVLGTLLAHELAQEPELRLAWRLVWFRLQYLAQNGAPIEGLFNASSATTGSPHLASDALRSLREVAWPQVAAEYGEYLVWGQ